jgi:ribonuclease P protein component
MNVLHPIKKRSDFLTVRNQGKDAVAKGLVLQTLQHPEGSSILPLRIGFVVSKKLGKAVARNRIKRRLRALCTATLPIHAHPGYDYVVIARHSTLERPFEQLQKDLKFTLHTTGTYAKNIDIISTRQRMEA